MNLQLHLMRIDKVLQVIRSMRLLGVFLRFGVLAGAEHRCVLSGEMNTVVDVGANRGQFALAVRRWAPKSRVISFEPLPGPADVFRRIFCNDDQVSLHGVAIGPCSEKTLMHVSGKDDSSSLLPISRSQVALFPGTAEVATTEVRVGPLEEFVSLAELQSPAMLKLDVQGFEYEALIGCESMLRQFDWVYCEASFVELYSGQRLAGDVIEWLGKRGFGLSGIYNPSFDSFGRSVQADLFFFRKDISA